MATQKEKLDFILQFIAEYPAHGREACVRAAGELLRLARRRRALAVVECNPPAHWERYSQLMANRMREDWEERLIRRKDKLLARVEAACAPFKLPYESQGDPRGPCLRVRFPSGASNRVFGRDYAVPA